MLSGRRLDLLDPSPADIGIDDVAHGLARVARWNGQTVGEHVFSVAQHSVFVEAIAAELSPGLPPPARLAVLLHDAAEYVVGDIITPLKAMIGDGYAAVEARLRAAIHLQTGLPPEPDPDLARLIKRADLVAAYCEATQLAGFDRDEADRVFGPPEIRPGDAESFLQPWPTAEAQRRFRARFDLLSAPRP
ncbi:MAG: metal-dependent phosphohydrolase [Enterovirga sp.]|jgi:5'-deoxynucleotidase YfbR-like HD superfamily hydrolase|nr:metal-dependent phosphohydrolase [Enterovirga sp.]